MRLYAEDPRTFLPQGGRITRLVLPESVRVDAGVAEGDEVALAYDPMIAKLIAHGPTRDDALDRLEAALAETVVEGVTTNLPFLRWLVAHPDVRAGPHDDGVPHRASAALAAAGPHAARARGAARGASTFPRRRRPRRPTSTPPRTTGTARTARASVTAPMPGTVIKVLVAARRPACRRASRCSSSRR